MLPLEVLTLPNRFGTPATISVVVTTSPSFKFGDPLTIPVMVVSELTVHCVSIGNPSGPVAPPVRCCRLLPIKPKIENVDLLRGGRVEFLPSAVPSVSLWFVLPSCLVKVIVEPLLA